jgi:hypothetical protein
LGILKGVKEALLIHHWDTDGICSAKILFREVGDGIQNNITPTLGNYFLTEEEISYAQEHPHVIIADMSLPERDVLRIKGESRVFIFDHHIQSPLEIDLHHNPVALGASPLKYPSTSIVVNEFLGREGDLYSYLGAVGDREVKIRDNNRLWPKLESFLGGSGIIFSDMLRMAHLLDSTHRVGDKAGVERVPHILPDEPNPRFILENEEWNQNLENLEGEVRNILAIPPEEVEGVLLKRMDTKYNIISTVTRRIAWETNRNTVVVNRGYLKGSTQIYARSGEHNLHSLIEDVKSKGYSAGGKEDVLGAVIPDPDVEFILGVILEYLADK